MVITPDFDDSPENRLHDASTDPMDSTGFTGGAHAAGKGSESPRSRELLDRVVQSAHEAIDRLAETAAPHVERLHRGVSDAGVRLKDTAGQARQVGDEWTESLRGTVRSNPLSSVATAFTLGMLFARLMR